MTIPDNNDKNAINLHAVLPVSRVNGPGSRMVVFFQGCASKCPGCFNPETHPFDPARRIDATELLEENLSDTVEGITVSGGEPFMQPGPLYALLEGARERSLSTVVYTGFAYAFVASMPEMALSLPLIDVLIDGPYLESAAEDTLLARGSKNQSIHLLTHRYSMDDMSLPATAEVRISADGTVVSSGFSRTLFSSERL